ncbi:YxeA family protein [Solibacillus daqui]|uniref:YxeA family protein n=1 Tax=Solibacillus daqui TaxID=2912187 RepID=UPI002365C7FF|nr:YxeA family protein [Solibacillus daqui]
MKKLFIAFGFVVALLVAGLVVLATMDFNRLGKDHVYVQITEDGVEDRSVATDGTVYMSYSYEQVAYDEDGKEVLVKFSASKNLRHEAYLMLYTKDGNEVTSYDEVQYDVLPAKVKAQFK